MDHMELKKIYKDILDGNLRSSVIFLKSLPKELNDKNRIYVNILCYICQLAAENDYKTNKNVSIPDLKEAITIIQTNIKDPIEGNINNYVKAFYHILKFLINKMPLGELYPLCEYILPSWITKLTDEVYDMLLFFCMSLNNDIIIPLAQKKETELLLKYTYLHLKIYKFTFTRNPKSFFSKFQSYCNFIQKLEITEYFSSYCLKVYNLLDDVEKLPDKATAIEFYNTFTMIVFIYFSNSKFEKIKSYTDKTFEIMKKYSSFDNELELCTSVFQNFYDLCTKKVDNIKNTDVILFRRLREDLEYLIKFHDLSSLVQTTSNYIFRLLRLLIDGFEKIEKNIWNNHMTLDIQIEYVKLLHIIGKIMARSDLTCDCSKKCKVRNDINHAIIIWYKSSIILSTSMKYESQNIEELQEVVFLCLRDCCKYTEILKASNCERWVVNWKSIGAILYNTATRFYRINNNKLSKSYFYYLCRYIIILEGVENSLSFMENSLGTSLNMIGICYFNMKLYRSALTYLAMVIKLCPGVQEKVWPYWCSVKASANKENLGNVSELTINQILEEDSDIIKQLYPNYVFEKSDNADLLLLEIRHYSKIWASKIPMNNTCKELFSICSDPLKRTYAINLCWDIIISFQDENFINNINRTIILLNKKEVRNNLQSQVCLSVLYYIDYQYKMYEILKKNLNEMNETVREEKPLKPYEEQNPNDKCDVIPTYYNNKIENIMHLQKILNKSVELWNKILEKDNFDTVKHLIEELNLSVYIKNTAFEYRLQNYSYEMFKIWFLYLKYGKLLENKNIIVTSIGFMLEVIDFNSHTIEMIQMAENLLKDTDLETCTTYYLNKSTGQLRCNLLKEGLQSLQMAEKYHLKLQESEKLNNKLEARILLLKSLYLSKPCILNLMNHNDNYIVYLQRAFTSIAEYYKTQGSKCHYTLSILFDLSYNIGILYKWLRMPREIRCYTSESVILAQQMVLPLRTVQFFSLLAFTDLLGRQFDDCKVKMSGIDYILCYRNNAKFAKNVEVNKVEEINKEFERFSIRNDNFETMLDVPMGNRNKNLRGSPILPTKPFKMPSFVYHLDCNCSYCTNIDYQRLVLECTHLEATFYLRENNMQISHEFFKGGLSLYKGLLRKYENVLNEDLITPFKKKLVFTYAKFLLDLSYYYTKLRDYDEALKNNNLICELLGEDLESNTYFYNEILIQKIDLLSAEEYEKNLLTNREIRTESSVDYDMFLSKTPENKVSVAKFRMSVSPCEDPTPQKTVRKHILFDLSSEDEKEKSPVKNKIFKFKTPAKTPAPKVSKIKIYTPAAGTNKVQPIGLDLSPKEEINKKIIKFPIEPETKPKRTQVDKRVLKEPNKILSRVPRKQEPKNSKPQKENVATTRKNVLDDISDGVAKLELKDPNSKAHTEINSKVQKETKFLSEPKSISKPIKTYSRTQRVTKNDTKTEPEKETLKTAPKQSRILNGAIKKAPEAPKALSTRTRIVRKKPEATESKLDLDEAKSKLKSNEQSSKEEKPVKRTYKRIIIQDDSSSEGSVRFTRNTRNTKK